MGLLHEYLASNDVDESDIVCEPLLHTVRHGHVIAHPRYLLLMIVTILCTACE